MTRTHQIHADHLPGTDQVTQRLFLEPRHSDRVKLPGQQQPDEMLGVTTIGLDPLPRRPGDLARRRDHALHAPLDQLPREPVPRRTGLIRDPYRPRQPGTEAGRPSGITVHHKRLQLARLSVEYRRDDLRRVHIQTDETSSFAMAGSSNMRLWAAAR